MRNLLRVGVYFAISLVLILMLGNFTLFIESLETSYYDLLTRLRAPQEVDDLAIVAIDQLSLAELEQQQLPWPWPRSVYALLIQVLNEAGARAIVFDVVFDRESQSQEDLAFAQGIQKSQVPVILAATIETTVTKQYSLRSEVWPLDSLREAGGIPGFALLNPDSDGILRRARLSVGGEPTLAVSAYQALGKKLELEEIPVVSSQDGDPEILINYAGPPSTVPQRSFSQLLLGGFPPDFYRGRVALVGRSQSIQDLSTTVAQADTFGTPASSVQMPGVEIHANILNSLLKHRFLGKAPASLVLGIALLLSLLITVFVLGLRRLRPKLLASLGLLAGFVILTAVLFLSFDYWVLTIQPLLMGFTTLALNIVHEYFTSDKERRHIRRALSGYVSSEVMNGILEDPSALELGGKQVLATVLFSDLKGFSKISEGISPTELASLLNDYFDEMGDAIMSRKGMINKYIGDAIMAIWGAPLANPDHAVLACAAALDMQHRIQKIPQLQSRIGLNTGEMVAGNLGHRERMEYTVIGDAVNLASRLEGANKPFGTAIMISEFTEELVREHFLTRQLDAIRVVGKRQPVKVYELIDRIDAATITPRLRSKLDSYAEILASYQERNWEQSVRLAENHLKRFSEDTVVSKVYLPRCREFLVHPPEPDWDGVYELKSK